MSTDLRPVRDAVPSRRRTRWPARIGALGSIASLLFVSLRCSAPQDGCCVATASSSAARPAETAPTVATAAPAEQRHEPIAPQWGATSKGSFTVGWSPVGGPVPVNEPFEIDLQLYSDAEKLVPLTGAAVRVTAWMPDHMHGMGRQSQTIESEPGRYRVRGMLLHMDGLWQLFVDVTANGKAERAEFAITLE